MRRSALAALLAVACSNGDQPAPARSAPHCLARAQRVAAGSASGVAGELPRLGCPELPAGVRACGTDRPTGRNQLVDLLVELDRAVLHAERFDAATADTLSRRSLLLREVAPAANTRPPEPPIVIAITPDGRARVFGQPVEDRRLPEVLRAAASRTNEVVIEASKHVPHRRAIEVVDIARAAGSRGSS